MVKSKASNQNPRTEARDFTKEPETSIEKKWREDEKLRREGKRNLVNELLNAATKVGSSFVTVRALEALRDQYIKTDEIELKRVTQQKVVK